MLQLSADSLLASGSLMVDGRWAVLKQQYNEMAHIAFEIARAERMRLLADFQVEDPETDERRSVRINIDDLTETFIAVGRTRAEIVEQEDEEVEVNVDTEDSEEGTSGLDADNEVDKTGDDFVHMTV